MAVTSFRLTRMHKGLNRVITDGENFEDDPVAAVTGRCEAGHLQADVTRSAGWRGALIPIGRDGQPLRDDNGTPVTTRLNEERWRAR